jgi:hypothetical protein
MGRTVFDKAVRAGRVTALALGVAVMLAMALGVLSSAFAADGDPWILGQNNAATAITRLAGKVGVDGPMVRITNNNTGSNDTALALNVQEQESPMTVNSDAKVANLNADKLDGKDSTDLGAGAMMGRIDSLPTTSGTTFAYPSGTTSTPLTVPDGVYAASHLAPTTTTVARDFVVHNVFPDRVMPAGTSRTFKLMVNSEDWLHCHIPAGESRCTGTIGQSTEAVVSPNAYIHIEIDTFGEPPPQRAVFSYRLTEAE